MHKNIKKEKPVQLDLQQKTTALVIGRNISKYDGEPSS